MKKIMKAGRIILSVLLFLVIFGLVFLVLPTKAEPTDQYHSSWKLIRETADEDGGDFLATYNLPIQGNFASKDSSTVANGGPYRIRSYIGSGIGTEFQSSGDKWMFAFCAKNYDVGNDNIVDNTFSFNIVGWSRINGMLQVIAEGDCVLGTQAVIVYPDAGDAVGALVDDSTAVYTHSSPAETFTVTNAGFTGTAVGMMAYVTSSDANATTGYYAITTATDANTIIISGMSSTGDAPTGSIRVQSNPAFWVDTINLDETTKWPSSGERDDANSVMVYNSGDNEVAFIVVETTGIEWIQFVIYGATPVQTGEAGDVTVYGRPY